MPIVPANKVCFICILCVFVMCIFVLIFNNKDKITKIFIFAHFGLNIHHSFLYFVSLKGFVFIIGKLFCLLCSDKRVKPTWQRIVIKSWNRDMGESHFSVLPLPLRLTTWFRGTRAGVKTYPYEMRRHLVTVTSSYIVASWLLRALVFIANSLSKSVCLSIAWV